MERIILSLAALMSVSSFSANTKKDKTNLEKPCNVLFIAVDDLNDWVGIFGGNPQVKTPNLDKLCNEKAMIFTNAHCAGPVSCPSRSALLSGFRPDHTGCYNNQQNMLGSDLVQRYATLPEYFSKNGYVTISKGKIFHRHSIENGLDEGQWAFDIWEREEGNDRVQRDHLYSRNNGIIDGAKSADQHYTGGEGAEFSWGPTIEPKEKTKDYLTALWFADMLKKDWDKPFFMAVGLSKPHLPWYVPQEFFDLYQLDTVKIPHYRLDDLDDILTPQGKRKFDPTDDFLWCSQNEHLFKAAVRAYMASVSYADACIGIILDALNKSEYAKNTIVIIWGDHGWHLGEKLRFRKTTLWTESTKLPLIIKTPEMRQKAVCNRTVNLIDLYPTLIDLCGLPKRDVLDGRSFAPLLRNPEEKWPYPSITIKEEGSYTINDEDWRYTYYADGTEELYNLKNDPMEWTNLINDMDKESAEAKKELLKWKPESFTKGLPVNKILKKFDAKNNLIERGDFKNIRIKNILE